MAKLVLVALFVEDVAEDDPNVLAFSVVVLATVVSAKEGVKVLCSVVTGKVGTLVLSAVVPSTTGVVDCSDVSESVVDPSDVSESLVDWTVLLELVIVEVIPTVVPLEE